ncbi:hypothetical protein [Roseobacter sp. HKCCA0434]|uniref:hypothetical protein n=1 Tax=Roseobacter sp. HKCCA0434 TaxID=3079297 RepID=UPI002905F079|nr:hypothetical protein [Roseobacter sp. HKCCA0434]
MSPLDDPRFATLRADWEQMVERRLPHAARSRHWPVSNDTPLGDILLSAITGQRVGKGETIDAAILPDSVLEDALELGEAVLEGAADLPGLNRPRVRQAIGHANAPNALDAPAPRG